VTRDDDVDLEEARELPTRKAENFMPRIDGLTHRWIGPDTTQ
jgi:hypothetical protein